MELKNALKTIISDFHERGLPQLTQRDIDVPLKSNKIITLIGPRRAGKTYMLYQLMSKIKDKTNILYINFEDERLRFKPNELQLIIDAYFELYPEKKEKEIYLFFDEIQEAKEWQSFVRRLHDTITKNIFLTGSSAKLLSKEIATSLRGRAISYEIFPLSFKEYLNFKGVDRNINSTKGKAKAMNLLEEYLEKGGFPETVLMEEEVYKKTMQSYFEVMLYRDIVERYSISKPVAVKELLRHLLSQTGKEFSINKCYNDFKSRGMKISKDSLYNFVDYFEDAFIILPVENYSAKQGPRKSYAIDTGLAKNASFSLSKDIGRLMETVVLTELKRKGEQVFYFKKGAECDFIIKEGRKIIGAIQVCYEINKENEAREINGLRKAMRTFKLKKGLMLTMNQEEKRKDIEIRPLLDWLVNA
jgi:hypothetical protein